MPEEKSLAERVAERPTDQALQLLAVEITTMQGVRKTMLDTTGIVLKTLTNLTVRINNLETVVVTAEEPED